MVTKRKPLTSQQRNLRSQGNYQKNLHTLRGGYKKLETKENIKLANERGAVRNATVTHKTNEVIRERQLSEQARISSRQAQADIAAKTMEQRRLQRTQTQQELNAIRNRQRVVSGTTTTVTRSSVWSTMVMITFLVFGMIVVYILVTNGQAFGAIAGTIGNFIHGLSSNSPLFISTSPGGTSGSGSTQPSSPSGVSRPPGQGGVGGGK